MHFKEWRVVPRTITDPYFKTPRTVESLLFLVDEVDGVAVDKIYSVVSETLANEFKPYLDDGTFRDYVWTIVKDGAEFVAPRIVSRRRR